LFFQAAIFAYFRPHTHTHTQAHVKTNKQTQTHGRTEIHL